MNAHFASENQMPSVSHAAQTRQIGNFYNTLNAHGDQAQSGRGAQRLLGISNASVPASSQICRADASQPGGYLPVHVEEEIAGVEAQQKKSGGQVATGGVCAAMKRHPWTTGVVLFLVAGTALSLTYKSMTNRSSASADMPEALPTPERLLNYWRADPDNVFDICQRAADKFPPSNRRQADSVSLSKLSSIKAETERMISAARSMVQDEKIEISELMRAARCSGVRLMRGKVEVMISDLEAMKSELLGSGGISIIAPIDTIKLQAKAGLIDQRLAVLREMRRNLRAVTVAINTKILRNAG